MRRTEYNSESKRLDEKAKITEIAKILGFKVPDTVRILFQHKGNSNVFSISDQSEGEIRKLRNELDDLKKENEILKKQLSILRRT